MAAGADITVDTIELSKA